jgi:transposase
LDEAERIQLRALIRKGKAAAYKLMHARVLLQADQRKSRKRITDEMVAKAVDIAPTTVARIRKRFVEEGLAVALGRKPQQRPSRQRRLDGKAEATLVATACSEPPEGRERWTLRLLGDRLVELDIVESISPETVRQTLKKTF